LFNRFGETEVAPRWWQYMKEVLISERAESPSAKEEILKEVFHLD
jgi:L-rhamnose mutarotase